MITTFVGTESLDKLEEEDTKSTIQTQTNKFTFVTPPTDSIETSSNGGTLYSSTFLFLTTKKMSMDVDNLMNQTTTIKDFVEKDMNEDNNLNENAIINTSEQSSSGTTTVATDSPTTVSEIINMKDSNQTTKTSKNKSSVAMTRQPTTDPSANSRTNIPKNTVSSTPEEMQTNDGNTTKVGPTIKPSIYNGNIDPGKKVKKEQVSKTTLNLPGIISAAIVCSIMLFIGFIMVMIKKFKLAQVCPQDIKNISFKYF